MGGLPIIPPPDSWKPELDGEVRSHEWRYIAGKHHDGREKTRDAHRNMRRGILQKETVRVFSLVPIDARTAEDLVTLGKIEEMQNKKDAVKAARTAGVWSNFEPKRGPPATWKPELEGNVRAHAWKYAAGQNPDGSDKTIGAHSQARLYIIDCEKLRLVMLIPEDERTAEDLKSIDKRDRHISAVRENTLKVTNKRDEILSKSERERTHEEHMFVKKMEEQRVKSNEAHAVRVLDPAQKEADKLKRSTPEYKANIKMRRDRPENKAKSKASEIKRAAGKTKKKMDKANEFIKSNGLDIGTASLSDDAAFQFILNLIGDTDSVVGKGIYEALGGMTLRTAFWEGKSNSAMYALMSRGDATMGDSTAEFTRFLVRNKSNTPILTRRDDNQDFKYTDQEFKDLQLVFCPIRAFSNYADVTTFESAFQLLFDFLEVGSQRLWKVSGVGKSTLPLRKCDKLFIERTGCKNLTFMFGITIMKNVTVVKRTTSAKGNTVACITGGLGTKCNVNQGSRRAPIINESQRAARDAAYATLPPNFRDVATLTRKRKMMDDETMEDETMEDETIEDGTMEDETIEDETTDDETTEDETTDDETMEDETMEDEMRMYT
ncbi:hypothetical protein T484DRAFT_1756147 [Baffinella frigidus]|nr:hypothetical protein T484DRAFT_1756147 [Cryptophyta sp. CCMP2293]